VSWWTITANGVFTANYVALESATSLRIYAHSLSVNYSVDDISIKAVTKEAGFVLTFEGKVLTIDSATVTPVDTTNFYIATTGDDNAAGTITEPWATWRKIDSVDLDPGDTVFIRGGVYTDSMPDQYFCRWDSIYGTAQSPIVIMAYPTEAPIWDFTGLMAGGVTRYLMQMFECSHVKVFGLRLRNAAQPGTSPTLAWNMTNCDSNTIEGVTIHDIGGFGFTMAHEGFNIGDTNSQFSVGNLFLNCDAYALQDSLSPSPFQGSDGFNITHNTSSSFRIRNNWAPGTTISGCRAWFCSDDGYDIGFRNDSTLTVINSWSFWNGFLSDSSNAADGIGFKMGPNDTTVVKTTDIQYTFKNNIAAKNRGNGFDQNTSATWYSSIHNMYNNFAFDNDKGFKFDYDTKNNTKSEHVLQNNAALDNSSGDQELYTDTIINSYNSWNTGITITSADFESLQYTQLFGARQADSSLPVLTFGHLATGSDLIDAGTDVGIAFNGGAPDLGAFESTDTVLLILESAELGTFDDSIVVMLFNREPNADSIPLETAFNLTQGGTSVGQDSFYVHRDTGFLALDSALSTGTALLIDYTKGIPAIQNLGGFETLSWSDSTVTNNISPYGPELVVDGAMTNTANWIEGTNCTVTG
ncbi:hypothetical protein LCGC14_2174720, partial [marine sediment metagenome]